MITLRLRYSKALLLLLLVLPNITMAQQPLPAEGDESQLLAVLNSDAELFAKAKACQRLAIIGTSESVPVLATLLADPSLSHYARTALESNPSSDVDKALRQAVGEVKGQQLVGVINSIAVRKDAQAVDVLKAAASDSDKDVAAAALSALGTIATPESIAIVQTAIDGESALQVTAADACLTAADELILQGKNEAALKVLATLRAADLPKHINVASRFGEIRTDSQSVNELMQSYLDDDDQDLFRIGLELAHHLTDAETTSQLVEELESQPLPRQILLIHVLGERGDVSALPAVVDAADSDDEGMRLAAVGVLGKIGDGSVVTRLLKAATTDNEALASEARESLTTLKGDDVDGQLAQRLEESEGSERLVLVDVAR